MVIPSRVSLARFSSRDISLINENPGLLGRAQSPAYIAI